MQLNVTSLSTLSRLSRVRSSTYFDRDSSEGISFANFLLHNSHSSPAFSAPLSVAILSRIAPLEIVLFPRTFVIV